MGGNHDVERLIEHGLERYGLGDVDGALLMWERALSIDPEDVRAAAYVDYVRENYELLLDASRSEAARAAEAAVPFGLDSVPGDDDYEIEVTRADERARVERYIESVDEGWFLGDEPAAPSGGDEVTGSYVPAPARPGTMGDDVAPPPVAAALDDGLELPDLDLGRPPSLRQLPLPAIPAPDGGGITLEIEADEPDDPPGAPGDDEQTGDFGARWPGAAGPPPIDLDFTDARSAAPTREVAAPRGFVRLPGISPLAAGRAGAPDGARGRDGDGDDGADEDDRLRTRPGRGPAGPLDAGPLDLSLAPEALAEFGDHGTSGGRAGPDERTRETPLVRVTFGTDSGDLELDRGDAGADDERTGERPAMRADTLAEPTTERQPAFAMPPPIEPGGDGDGDGDELGSPPDGHPPLVIIEDPVLAGEPGAPTTHDDDDDDAPAPPASDPHDEAGDFASPAARDVPTRDGLVRPRRESPSRVAPLATEDLEPETAKLPRAALLGGPAAEPVALRPAPPPGDAADPSSLGALGAQLDAELDRDAPAGEAASDRTRRRITALIDRAIDASTRGEHTTAIVALDLALRDDPGSAIAQKLLHRHQPAILDCYQRFLGDLSARPALAVPMHELADQKLDIRAAFLLSRIDGSLTFEEVLDVSGMPRAEAFRHLSLLVLRGILVAGS